MVCRKVAGEGVSREDYRGVAGEGPGKRRGVMGGGVSRESRSGVSLPGGRVGVVGSEGGGEGVYLWGVSCGGRGRSGG